MNLFFFFCSILFILSIFQQHSLTTYILFIIWITPPILLAIIMRQRFKSLISISRNPKQLEKLDLFNTIMIFLPLLAFGWVSALVLIETYMWHKKEERKHAPWWRLKEYGGKF